MASDAEWIDGLERAAGHIRDAVATFLSVGGDPRDIDRLVDLGIAKASNWNNSFARERMQEIGYVPSGEERPRRAA